MYSFKDFLLAEENDKKSKAKSKKPKDNNECGDKKQELPKSREATHAGMSFYSPGEL